MDDEYGYKERFKSYDVDQLIVAFNKDTGHNGWVRARGFFLVALREAFLATGLDCSDFITDGGMSMHYQVKCDGNRIVQVGRPERSKDEKPVINMILVKPALEALKKEEVKEQARQGQPSGKPEKRHFFGWKFWEKKRGEALDPETNERVFIRFEGSIYTYVLNENEADFSVLKGDRFVAVKVSEGPNPMEVLNKGVMIPASKISKKALTTLSSM